MIVIGTLASWRLFPLKVVVRFWDEVVGGWVGGGYRVDDPKERGRCFWPQMQPVSDLHEPLRRRGSIGKQTTGAERLVPADRQTNVEISRLAHPKTLLWLLFISIYLYLYTRIIIVSKV